MPVSTRKVHYVVVTELFKIETSVPDQYDKLPPKRNKVVLSRFTVKNERLDGAKETASQYLALVQDGDFDDE